MSVFGLEIESKVMKVVRAAELTVSGVFEREFLIISSFAVAASAHHCARLK